MKNLKVILFAVVFPLLAGVAIAAQDYPTGPIRIIVPTSPGGTTDLVARIISPGLSRGLGQQIVVDNRPGASGNVGVEIAARTKPDGHTVLLGSSGYIAINQGLYPKFPVKPMRDFIAVTQIVDSAGALVVHPSFPMATIKEFIEYAKANPEKLNYGSSGAGAPFRLAMEYFMHEAGLKIIHVPYKGSGAATIGILSGEVKVAFVSLMPVLTHIKAGKLKLLSVVAPKRLELVPDTPTMVESGFPAMTAGAWQGMYVPAGTPQLIVTRLFDAFSKTVTDPEVVKQLTDAGTSVVVSRSPAEFAEFTKAEIAFYAKVINAIGLVGE